MIYWGHAAIRRALEEIGIGIATGEHAHNWDGSSGCSRGGGDVVDLVSTTFIIIIDLLQSHVRIVSTTEQLKMKL